MGEGLKLKAKNDFCSKNIFLADGMLSKIHERGLDTKPEVTGDHGGLGASLRQQFDIFL